MKKYILVFGVGISAFIFQLLTANVSYEQAVHFYSSGRLLNATTLPNEEEGLIKVYRARNRGFGTFELISMIKTVAKEMAEQFPGKERMQIADIANAKGGSVGQHKSHQNGLDADIIYFRKNNKEQDPLWAGDFAEKFVRKGKVTENFDIERNWTLLNKLASFPQVERIFVDIAIKRNFCKMYASNSDSLVQRMLRLMRPAGLHDDHMHVRISCPPGSKRCLAQKPQPEGNGCSEHQMEMDLMQSRSEMADGC